MSTNTTSDPVVAGGSNAKGGNIGRISSSWADAEEDEAAARALRQKSQPTPSSPPRQQPQAQAHYHQQTPPVVQHYQHASKQPNSFKRDGRIPRVQLPTTTTRADADLSWRRPAAAAAATTVAKPPIVVTRIEKRPLTVQTPAAPLTEANKQEIKSEQVTNEIKDEPPFDAFVGPLRVGDGEDALRLLFQGLTIVGIQGVNGACAFVEFPDKATLERALKVTPQKLPDGRNVNIRLASKRPSNISKLPATTVRRQATSPNKNNHTKHVVPVNHASTADPDSTTTTKTMEQKTTRKSADTGKGGKQRFNNKQQQTKTRSEPQNEKETKGTSKKEVEEIDDIDRFQRDQVRIEARKMRTSKVHVPVGNSRSSNAFAALGDDDDDDDE